MVSRTAAVRADGAACEGGGAALLRCADSKVLSEKQRENLFTNLKVSHVAAAWVPSSAWCCVGGGSHAARAGCRLRPVTHARGGGGGGGGGAGAQESGKIGWAVMSISPEAISAQMLRRCAATACLWIWRRREPGACGMGVGQS
jgi:hypothetical protein